MRRAQARFCGSRGRGNPPRLPDSRPAAARSFDGGGSGEVAVFEAVAVAFEGEDFGVVDEPVDHRGGGDLVAEDLAPRAERLVAGDDQRLARS